MAKLGLSFLGPPLVNVDGAAIELKLRKAIALLTYLALTGQRHSRDELAELLFPRQDRKRGRANLRQILSALHGALGTEHVTADRAGICLSGQPEVDVLEFRRLAGAGRKAAQSGDAARSVMLLGEAVGLARGELLAGFFLSDSASFEAWQATEGERLRLELVGVLRLLVELREKRGEWAAGIEEGRRWLALEPLEEEAHRTLMRLLALSGERGAALRQYERCRDILQRESSQAPGPQTEELRRTIASGELAGSGGMPGSAEVRRQRAERPSNLPAQPTSFVGRESELAAVVEALGRQDVRLLTLTGPGGTGKTRLALEAASRLRDSYEHGVFIVELAALRDPRQVAAAIAAAPGDVYQETAAGRSLLDVLRGYLRSRQLLLVLDNFEHLLPAASDVAELLAGCPKLKVLATSREPLRIRAEHELPVPSLGLPPVGEMTAGQLPCESVRLFEERAAAVLPGFKADPENAHAIAEICRRLDGLPLAIELAAARVKAFPLPALLDRLEHRLRLLTDGPRDLPDRQRTMRSEIGWSYELLPENERQLFCRLAAFAGGFTIEAAQAVCTAQTGGARPDMAEGLAVLARKSLLRKEDQDGQPRFRMLQVVREYAGEELERSGESGRTMRLFALHYLERAEQAEPFLYGPDQSLWLSRLDRESDNVREALAWFRDSGATGEGLRLAGALGWYWFRRARFAEGHSWLEQFHSRGGPEHPPAARAKVAYHLGLMEQLVGRSYLYNPAAAQCYRVSIELWQKTGDRRGVALSLAGLGRTLTSGWEEPTEEERACQESSVARARESGDAWTIGWCLTLACTPPARPDLDAASKREALEEAIRFARSTGDPFLMCQACLGMGIVLQGTSASAEAEAWLKKALGIAREVNEMWSTFQTLSEIAGDRLRASRLAEAKGFYAEGIRMSLDLGVAGFLHWFVGGFDYVARKEGRMKRASLLRACAILWLFPSRQYFKDDLTVEPGRGPHTRPTLLIDEATDRQQWVIAQTMTMDEIAAYALSDKD